MRTPEQWARIKEHFEAARTLPEEERAAYIEAHTTGEVRAELLSLMQTYAAQESNFLETPAGASLSEILSEGWTGKRFGAYEAVRLLGEGGMGSVYEGIRADGAFEQRVAIKIMKPELVSAHLLERFGRERQILASLDHPHIARLLDGGEREAAPWPVPFMVMEFIDGIPIHSYAAEKKLNPRQRAALVADVCDAVAYAHGRQVVHRDIKPGNVMVDHSGRVKLLDFGISKILSSGSSEVYTATIMRMATPEYASPEQLRGEPIGPASDIFSLGALLYEVVSGVRLARDRWKPLVDGALDCIARQACAPRPQDRYQTAAELAADLRRYGAGERVQARRVRRVPLAVWAAAAVCLLALPLAWWRLQPGSPRKPLVAVLQLRNLSGKPGAAWVSTAATEILAAELAAGGAVRMVPGELATRAARELNLEPAESYSRETLRKLRAYLNADRVVTGSFLSVSDQPADPLRFQFQMQDTRSGAVQSPVTESASISELSAMATRASGRFRQALGAATPAGKGLAETKPEALRYYADGLNFQRNFDFPHARVALEQAVALDPGFAMAHFRLSEVFRILGNVPQADAEVRLARQTSAGLHEEDRLAIEGAAILRGPANQRPESVAVYRKLRQLDPSSVDFALLLANSQMVVNDAPGLQQSLRELRQRQQPPDIARIDLFEAEATYRRGEFQNSWKLATHCADAARASGSRLLLAECLFRAGSADQVTGDRNRALDEMKQAEVIFSASGNRKRVADLRNTRAGVFVDQGMSKEALAEFEGVVEIARDIGSQSLESAALSNMGIAYSNLGQYQAAVQSNSKAIEIMRPMHDSRNLAYARGNLAIAYMGLGDLKAADESANQALGYARQVGGALEGSALLTLAGIREWEGRLQESRQLCAQALESFEKNGARRYAAYAKSMMGEMSFDSGDDKAADEAYNAALAIAKETKEDDLVPLVYSDQTRVALARGDYQEAARLARAALGANPASKAGGKDVLWHAFLALALAGQGQPAQAAAEQRLAVESQASNVRPDIRAELFTVEGWLFIGERKFQEAVRVLEDARKVAAQMPGARGEAELALAEAHFAMGDRSGAMAEFRALAARHPEMRTSKLAKARLAQGGPLRPMP